MKRDKAEVLSELDVVIRVLRQSYSKLDFVASMEEEKSLLKGNSISNRKRPAGVILILSEWWCPWALGLLPLIAAIVSGCSAVIIPSSRTTACNQLLSEILHQSVDQESYHVITEDQESGLKTLSSCPFAAAELQQLSSQPYLYANLRQAAPQYHANILDQGVIAAIVDRSAHLETAAFEICQAFYSFQGSSPKSPRCVFVDEFVIQTFKTLLKNTISENFSDVIRTSNDLQGKDALERQILKRSKIWKYPPSESGATTLLAIHQDE